MYLSNETNLAFEEARGHEMKYDTFKDALMNCRHLPPLAVDSNTEKGTQTNKGYWVCESEMKERFNNHNQAREKKYGPQVNLTVRRDELVDTRCGGYMALIPNNAINRTGPNRADQPRRHSQQRTRNPYEHNWHDAPTNASANAGSMHSSSHLSNPYQSNRPYPAQYGYQQRNHGPSNNSHTPENLLSRNHQYQSSSSHSNRMSVNRTRPSRFESNGDDSNRSWPSRFEQADLNRRQSSRFEQADFNRPRK